MVDDDWVICDGKDCLGAACPHTGVHRRNNGSIVGCNVRCKGGRTCRQATDAEIVMHVMVRAMEGKDV